MKNMSEIPKKVCTVWNTLEWNSVSCNLEKYDQEQEHKDLDKKEEQDKPIDYEEEAALH